jgi:hypothetical protein
MPKLKYPADGSSESDELGKFVAQLASAFGLGPDVKGGSGGERFQVGSDIEVPNDDVYLHLSVQRSEYGVRLRATLP